MIDFSAVEETPVVEGAVEAAEEPATKKKKKRKSGVVTEPEPETPSVEIPVAPADQTPAAGFYFHFINSHGAFLRVSVGYNHREYQGRFYSLKYHMNIILTITIVIKD